MWTALETGEGASAVAAGGGREQRDARAREMQRPCHFSRRPYGYDGWCVGVSLARSAGQSDA